MVALTEDMSDRKLTRGQVGTVVELLAPDVLEVEFTDSNGRAYAELAVKSEKLLILHYEPALA